jgi:uncharacterized protein
MNCLMKFPGAKILFFLLLGVIAFPARAQFEIPPKPPAGQQTSLYDYTGLLNPSQKSSLEQKLVRYSDSTSTQIVIAIIASTEGENIQYLGAQWGHEWGIGQEREDNGILVLLARDDRRIAINTGYGVEEFLTDALSRRIIEGVIIPEFKKGDYYAGLDRGTDAIFQVLTGQFTAPPKTGNGKGFPLESFLPFIIFFIIILILASRNKRGGGGKGGGRKRGLDIWDMIILSNMGRSSSRGGWGGSGGGSFGGGGFGGGFGGGGFGGGGASGGW